MSGHSKWSTIKHKKEAQDKKRGVLFSKISKDILVAVKEGGSGNANDNPRLRMVLVQARAANMPTKNIERAISRATKGAGEASDLQELVYEGYGPAGVAFVVVSQTDNRQRASATIKNVFEKSGGSIGSPGCALFLFEKKEAKYTPKIGLPYNSDEIKKKIERLIEDLSLLEDVVEVFTNTGNTNE